MWNRAGLYDNRARRLEQNGAACSGASAVRRYVGGYAQLVLSDYDFLGPYQFDGAPVSIRVGGRMHIDGTSVIDACSLHAHRAAGGNDLAGVADSPPERIGRGNHDFAVGGAYQTSVLGIGNIGNRSAARIHRQINKDIASVLSDSYAAGIAHIAAGYDNQSVRGSHYSAIDGLSSDKMDAVGCLDHTPVFGYTVAALEHHFGGSAVSDGIEI